MTVRRFVVAVVLAALVAAPAARAWSLRGVVAWRGAAVGGAACRLVVEGSEVGAMVTSAQGTFSFDGVTGERAAVVVQAEGCFPARRTVLNFTGNDVTLDVPVKRRIKWSLDGHVNDGAGRPLAGALLTFLEADGPRGPAELGTATSDGAGRYRFSGLEDTACLVRVELAGFRAHTSWLRNVGQTDRTLDVVLRGAD